MRVGIVEDDPLAAERLERILKELDNDIEIIFKVRECDKAFKSIEKEAPEVLFLDINLADGNVFSILEKLSYEPYIVFVTAYDEYAVKAFEEGAVDYILKPITKERVEKCLERIKRALGSEVERAKEIALKIKIRKLPVKLKDEIVLVDLDDIIYIEADDKRVNVITGFGKLSTYKKMSDLERELPREKFIRIHKSYIVSIDHISKITKWFSGGYMVEMDNGDLLRISKKYQNTILKALGIK